MPIKVHECETLVRRGDFEAAWVIDQHVLATRDPATRDDLALPNHLRWVCDGSSFANRRAFVRCYHGLGDTIQFARFLPPLGAEANSFTVETKTELIPLLRGLPNIDRLIPFVRDKPAARSECDIEIMEVPFATRARADTVGAPYLFASPAQLPPKRSAYAGRSGTGSRIELFPPVCFVH